MPGTVLGPEVAIKMSEGDFPGGSVVKGPPSNVGGVGLIPGQGSKVPYAEGYGQKLKKKKDEWRSLPLSSLPPSWEARWEEWQETLLTKVLK